MLSSFWRSTEFSMNVKCQYIVLFGMKFWLPTKILSRRIRPSVLSSSRVFRCRVIPSQSGCIQRIIQKETHPKKFPTANSQQHAQRCLVLTFLTYQRSSLTTNSFRIRQPTQQQMPTLQEGNAQLWGEPIWSSACRGLECYSYQYAQFNYHFLWYWNILRHS